MGRGEGIIAQRGQRVTLDCEGNQLAQPGPLRTSFEFRVSGYEFATQVWVRYANESSMKWGSLSRTFLAHFNRDAGAPAFALLLSLSRFDMRLLVFSFTAVSGPQLSKADK